MILTTHNLLTLHSHIAHILLIFSILAPEIQQPIPMSFIRAILFINLFIATQLTNAQSKPDSLKRLIQTEKVAIKKVDLQLSLAKEFRRKSTDSSIFYTQKALKKAQEIKYDLGIANANIVLGWTYYTRSEYKKAESYCFSGMEYYKKTEEYNLKTGSCYRLLASIYTKENKVEKAIENLLIAKDIYNHKSFEKDEIKSVVLNDIAYLYLEMDNYIMSSKYINESIALAKNNDQTAILADCYNILATITNRQKNFDKAIEYYELAKGIYNKQNDLVGVALCNTNLGISNFKKKSYLKAIEYSEIAKKQGIEIQLNIAIIESLINLCKSHIELNNIVEAEKFLVEANNFAKKTDRSLADIVIVKSELENKKGNHRNSVVLLKNYIENNKNVLDSYEEMELLKYLATAYESNMNYKDALNAKNKQFHIQDSINNINKSTQVYVLQAEFDYRKVKIDLKNKEVELQISKNKAENSRFIIILLTFAGLLLIIITTLIYLRGKHVRKTKQEIWETKQELQESKQKQSDDEISFKNKQITDFALHISEKNELLLSIKDKIKAVIITEKIKNKKLHDLILFLNNNLEQNKEKVALYSVADNTKDAFYHKLRELYPAINEKETRVAAYVRLNLASKQIGIQLNITKASVDNYRHSLRKKMNVPKDVFLYDFIKKI